jgi:hypothetical protein
VCYLGILRYSQKLNIITISEEKPKLHTNREDITKKYRNIYYVALNYCACCAHESMVTGGIGHGCRLCGIINMAAM